MNDFIYAKKLKKIFEAKGSYYSIKTELNEKISCRNVLEIYDKSLKSKFNAKLIKHKPDALFIMMNPGSSKPINLSYSPPIFNLNSNLNVKISKNDLVLAKPDTTQYQIMRVMLKMNWKHVRIINLSDIVETKSNKFIIKFENFKNNNKSNIHSIFAKARKEELSKVLDIKKNGPIIAAWGSNLKLIPLIDLSLASLNNKKIYGVKHSSKNKLYLHPYQRTHKDRISWVNTIVNQLFHSK